MIYKYQSLSISAALDYMHWGELVEQVVDQRGEVALLTKNIVIHGEMADKCSININPSQFQLH